MGTNTYYTNQLITYLGNKRTLLGRIEKIVNGIIKKDYKSTDRENIIAADLFSGSGVVSRMLKTHAGKLIVNDFEPYSKIINECYLTNKEDFDEEKFDMLLQKINNFSKNENGIIRKYYSPKNDKNIKKSDRCFYTNENAILIDTFRKAIAECVPDKMQKFFIAPLLYEASVHVNTGGMFKGFYKDKGTKIGKFGGTNSDCLKRITGKIELKKPILSDYDSDVSIYCEDTNKLVRKIEETIDIAYIDSPYNQHSYGSNYFMLNTILKNENINPQKISRVSGIPNDWKSSEYCKKDTAMYAMEDLVANLKAKWILISYSSNGIIALDEMKDMLAKYGKFRTEEKIRYSLLRSSRNRKQNNNEVTEYVFVLNKRI